MMVPRIARGERHYPAGTGDPGITRWYRRTACGRREAGASLVQLSSLRNPYFRVIRGQEVDGTSAIVNPRPRRIGETT